MAVLFCMFREPLISSDNWSEQHELSRKSMYQKLVFLCNAARRELMLPKKSAKIRETQMNTSPSVEASDLLRVILSTKHII